MNDPRAAGAVQDLHKVSQKTQEVVQGKWVGRISRLGLVTRGVVYFVPGVFAVMWAMGRHRRSLSQSSAIDVVGQQPFGRVLLMIVAVGLAGYAIWSIVRAVFDPQGRGHSPKGVGQRIGYATSAIAYISLFVATVRLLTGDLSKVDHKQDMTMGLLAHPFGAVAVVILGLCWIFGSGLAQVVVGWTRQFERDLEVERMSSSERRWIVGFGRVGLVSRGVVFTIIGGLLVAAGLHLHPGFNAGLEGALRELGHQPFGRVLVGVAGMGLIVFAIYSAMCARWMRMSPASGSASGSSPQSHPHSK
ncbi:MAG: DUF1206 domain-containing protein [Candidatus Eisenbacteria bacterium]